MDYSIKAHSISKSHAAIDIKQSEVSFGITPKTADTLPSPAELFLGSFASCVLKNVERFSSFMKFDYSKAEIEVIATRLEKPPRMDELRYTLTVYSRDDINSVLLKKNIEKFGTIYNTVKLSCSVSGEVLIVADEGL